MTSKGSISDLGAMSVLLTKGVDVEKIQWQPMAFPDMGPAMQRGDIDAAVVAEPWGTRTEKEFGATALLDISSGPTQDISMSGWAATEKLPARTRTLRRLPARAGQGCRGRQEGPRHA